MKNLLINLTFLLPLIQVGCNDDPCFKGSGNNIIEVRMLPDQIRGLRISHHLNMDLYIDTVNYIEIQGGENIIPFIKTEMDGKFLVVWNENQCSYLRNFDQNLHLTFHVKSLEEIEYESSGYFIMHDTLSIDEFFFSSHNASGSVILMLNVRIGDIMIVGGFPDVTIQGKVSEVRLLNGGSAWMYAQLFRSKYARLENRSSGDLIATVTDSMSCMIKAYGNIRYYGHPKVHIASRTGKGNVFPADL